MENINTDLIGRRLKYRRKMLNMTQKELANKVSIHLSTVSRYEKGEIKDCKMPVLESFARALDCNPAWLMGYDVAMEVPVHKILHQAAEEKAKMDGVTELIKHLSKDNYDKWLEYGEWLLSKQLKED